MFEKHEKWIVLGIIALVIYYFYKKGKVAPVSVSGANPPDYMMSPNPMAPLGSIVNPTFEPGTIQPAQATTPVLFKPAQPSTVPISQRVSVGTYNWYPAPPTLRYAPADRII